MNPFKWTMPDAKSTIAEHIDPIMYFVHTVSAIFFVPITVILLVFIFKYRRKSESEPMGKGPTHNTPVEITWSVVPMLIVAVMFWVGLKGWLLTAQPPEGCHEISVEASQWKWDFIYPNGARGPKLYAWVDQPIQLNMTSKDVLHAFFVPEFRVKRDIVPGKLSVVWFEATEPGTYLILCAEYCGNDHSRMVAEVQILATRELYDEAVAQLGKPKPGEKMSDYGLRVYTEQGCASCHTLDGTSSIGPSWLDIGKRWGQKRKVRTRDDEIEVVYDYDYVQESILQPAAKIAWNADTGKWFPNQMAAQGLNQEQIQGIVEFMKTLGKGSEE